MEWVETTGSTVEEAKEAALDELGVDEADAEFEVIAEPRAGLFGRLRSEARVRARVRPTAPRAKEDRRDRRRRTSASRDATSGTNVLVDSGGPGSGGPAPVEKAEGRTSTKEDPAVKVAVGEAQAEEAAAPTGRSDQIGESAQTNGAPARSSNRRRRNRRSGARMPEPETSPPLAAQDADNDRTDNEEGEGADVDVDLEEQGKVAAEFLTQLTAEFGLNASVSTTKTDDDTLELQMTGSDLGLFIGPKGSTLLAIQNLARTIVHYETGANNGQINIDVGGYRQKRTEALVRFAHQVAAKVKQSGARTALEPMSAVDRKVVHDALSEMEGVSTVSEGEEPRRRVVVVPAPVNS
jgi:spoIIIJ-associated protein